MSFISLQLFDDFICTTYRSAINVANIVNVAQLVDKKDGQSSVYWKTETSEDRRWQSCSFYTSIAYFASFWLGMLLSTRECLDQT